MDASLSVPETLTCDVISSCTRVRLSGAERDARPPTVLCTLRLHDVCENRSVFCHNVHLVAATPSGNVAGHLLKMRLLALSCPRNRAECLYPGQNTSARVPFKGHVTKSKQDKLKRLHEAAVVQI